MKTEATIAHANRYRPQMDLRDSGAPKIVGPQMVLDVVHLAARSIIHHVAADGRAEIFAALGMEVAPSQVENDSHVCPECAAGKHRNCDGGAWCLIEDAPTSCACAHGAAA